MVPRANNVRKLNTRIKYDRVSAIRNDYVPSLTFPSHPDYPDVWAPTPFFNADFIDSTNARDNPEWVLLANYSGLNADDNLAKVRTGMVNNRLRIIVTGDFSNNSVLTLQRSKSIDFSSDVIDLLEITDEIDTFVDFIDVTTSFDDYPYVRIDVSNYNSGDIITAKISAIYDNALTRVLNNYTPGIGQPQLSEIINSHYLGTIVDGFLLNFQEGWDGTPWDYVGWDNNSISIDDYLDAEISGGAFYTYEGDDTTNVYNLPPFDVGNLPWIVFASDLTLNPLAPVELEINVHYSIDSVSNTITLIAGAFPWLSGSNNLDNDWSISILDSTYTSESAIQTIIEGYFFTQPHVEGWPEELVPLKLNDSTILTVVTSGNLSFNLLENNQNITTDLGWDENPWDYIGWDSEEAANLDAVTFDNQTPLLFTFSGINGETVVLEGSNTGAFSGEETTIVTVTSDTTIEVPDTFSGFDSFTFYRARITVFGSGNVSVIGQINFSPRLQEGSFLYLTSTGLGPYELDFDIQDENDLTLTRNGVYLESGVDFTVNVSANTVTFTSPLTNGDTIQIKVWDRNGIINTNPTWASSTYNGVPLDITSFGGTNVESNPTQPPENSILVFADDSGFRRLRPPKASYHVSDGVQDEYTIVENAFNLTTSDVSVWIEDILQNQGTDYQINTGGTFNPQITITNAAPNGGYLIDDVLSVDGGTGIATTFRIASVKPINAQTQTSYVGRFTGGTNYNIGDIISLKDGTNITVNTVSSGAVSTFTVDSLNSTGTNENNTTLDQISTTGFGGGFSITLNSTNEEVSVIQVVDEGLYTVNPASPNSPTGGMGTGLQITLSNYSTRNDTIQFIENGMFEGYVSDVSISTNGFGTGYLIGDTLQIVGGTSTVTSEVRIIKVGIINTQTSAEFDGVGNNGSFTPGSGYITNDTITMSDGSVFTIIASGGQITGWFSINTSNSTGSDQNNVTLTQIETSGSGLGFTVTLGNANQEIREVAITNSGVYTASPTNPVSVTGGSGSGALLDATVLYPPEERLDISVRWYDGNQEYVITGNNIDFPTLPNGTNVLILGFTENNKPLKIQTKVFEGNSTLSDDGYLYYIDNTIPSDDYIIITADTSGAPIGGEELTYNSYNVIAGAGWDTEAWDNGNGGFDNHLGSVVELDSSYNQNDSVVITSFSGTPILPTLTYRIFYGYDDSPDNIFREAIRLSNDSRTAVTTIVQPKDNIIRLADTSILPETNGVVWINGERIEYLQRTGGLTPGASGSITGLVRGSKGTRKNLTHNVNTDVYAGDESRIIVNGFTNVYNNPNRRLQTSTTQQARFIQEEPGGYKNF